jgi:hypothetical protein
MRLARNTIYSKRVALGWVTKFTRAMNLDLEVLDGHSLGADGVTDRLVAFMEFVADSADAKNDTGLALASTVATYASVWIDAHQLLPTPIDVTWLKPKVKEWKSGRTRNMTGAFGIIRKMQKAGITRDMIEQMYELDIWDSLCKGDPVLVVVVKAAGQLAFVMMLRRSEYTLVRGISEFNPHLRMTRSNIVWIGANGQPLLFDEEGNLDRDDLLALLHLVNDPETTLDDFHGRMDATVKTSKSDQTGEWSSHVHPIALRLACEGQVVIKAANYYLELELADPVLHHAARETTPLFRVPSSSQSATNRQLKVDLFDDVIIRLLHEVSKRRGEHRSISEIRRMYSLHSFRIGGVNHLRAAGVPREIRMILGRWRSDAIDTYSRTDVKQFLEYLKDQGISAPAFETLAEDLPYHEDAHGVAYGESYNVITEHDKSTPKLIPEITVYEATRELRSLTPTGNEGVEALNRRHSLTGRRVEMYFQAADGPPRRCPWTHRTGDLRPGQVVRHPMAGRDGARVLLDAGNVRAPHRGRRWLSLVTTYGWSSDEFSSPERGSNGSGLCLYRH